ncbi:ATPase family associated with various cellular activities [Thermodesulfovibrio aggregans]|uniref:ATPase family associated with various cellular activities n=1 Tax=Thermodesulfovibrio aggregans TaxID=86166 RepID=A0A0U9HQX9_9BACT|nr:ATP-binding protein [Thermodesulfovibrio aggregans]GAQ95440.1 ATPase family associated with various cellular activities [Thermodesulfovibrio aggregans]
MRKIGRFRQNLTLPISSFIRMVNYEIYQSIKSYLLKIHMGLVSTDSFELVDLFSFTQPGIFSLPNIMGFDLFENVMSSEPSILGVIRFRRERYFISCTSFEDRVGKIYCLVISGEITGDFRPADLAETILKEAVLNSGYSGKILRLVYDSANDKLTFKIIPPPDITLEDIYLIDKTDLEDFVDSVRIGGSSLRYLFIGEPGTGKTDTIRAIISECKKIRENLTIFVVDAGCGVSLEVVFEFAEIFRPVLVCIDDIDLLVGSRDRTLKRDELSTALQALDGFITKDNIFLIATTNDRYLVDFALRRPGRFDLIIEFGCLEAEFYSTLVMRESRDDRLAEVFKDERILKRLSSLKVTGAFLVTLVKYLSRERFRNIRYEPEAVLSAINRLYGSFKSEIKHDKVGFQNS